MTQASQFFLTLVPLLTSYLAREYKVHDEKTYLAEESPEKMFDFIVVGGGTAGCVVARRLAEARFKVLLLEAGGTPPQITDVPLAEPGLVGAFTQETTYFYRSTKQENFQLNNDGIMTIEASKMLGGGSSHNGMIYQRGSPLDYDSWANSSGDTSWQYESMVKYFRKMENYMGTYAQNGQHGSGGPITITSPYFPAGEVWLEAGKELGYEIRDPSGPQGIGFSHTSTFTKGGFRENSYSSYIKPVEDSLKNYLTIRRYSPVHRIIFENKAAIGVEYKRHGAPMMAKATKEIILCAGSYISPILLIKSGVGPMDELIAANVTPVMELPQVGNNLQDHPRVVINPFHIKDKTQRWSMKGDLTDQDLDDVFFRGNSYLGSPAVTYAYFTSTLGQKENPDHPDLQIIYFYQTLDNDSNGCQVALMLPKSRGYLKVNNSVNCMMSNYLPVLNFRYLTQSYDEQVLVEGIQLCLKIMENTTAFNKIGTSFAGKPIPACQGFEFRSAEYWRCFVRRKAVTNWHAVGTCRMGKEGGVSDSVVDPKLRVHGVENLRVIDASIMPTVPAANTCGPTYAIAEKGADAILDKYSEQA